MVKVVAMKKKLLLVLLMILVLQFKLTASLPISRVHNDQHEQEGPLSSNSDQDYIKSKSSLPQTKDASSSILRLERSSEGRVHRKKAHAPGPSHLRLASRDQSKTSQSSKSAFHEWFSTNHRKPKFIAISIFVGCLVFMAWAFAITCCWYHRKETKRIKKATNVDVQSRQQLIPDQVSRIEDAHIDVGGY